MNFLSENNLIILSPPGTLPSLSVFSYNFWTEVNLNLKLLDFSKNLFRYKMLKKFFQKIFFFRKKGWQVLSRLCKSFCFRNFYFANFTRSYILIIIDIYEKWSKCSIVNFCCLANVDEALTTVSKVAQKGSFSTVKYCSCHQQKWKNITSVSLFILKLSTMIWVIESIICRN